jgi:hypothetical protein
VSEQKPPIPPIVDLRRWREARPRRLRTGDPPPSSSHPAKLTPPELAALPALSRTAPLTPGELYPARLGWLWRILAFLGGAMFFAMGAGLLWLFFYWVTRPNPGKTDLAAWFLILPVGSAIALFGLDLLLRGLLGVEWSIRFWLRAGPWLARRVLTPLERYLPPAPFFFGLTVILVGISLWYGRTDPSAWKPALFLLVLFVHILAHEWGHLFAVRRVGYVPLSLVAGPLLVDLKGRRPVAGGNPSWFLALLGGFVLWTALPERRSRARDFAVVLAGPLVTLLLLAAVLLADRFHLFGGSPVFAEIVRINRGTITVVLILNLLPIRTLEGVATDGRQLLDLFRGRLVS